MHRNIARLISIGALLALCIGVATVITLPISTRLQAIEDMREQANQARSAMEEQRGRRRGFHVDIPVESSLGGSISQLEEYGQAFWRGLTPAQKAIFGPHPFLAQTPWLLEWEESPPIDRDDFRSGGIDRQLYVSFFIHGPLSPAQTQSLEKMKVRLAEHLRSEARRGLADNAVCDARVVGQYDGRIEVEVTLRDGVLWPGRIVFEELTNRKHVGEKWVQVAKCRILKNRVGWEQVRTQTFMCDIPAVARDGADLVVWIYGYPFQGQWIRSERVAIQ